MASIMRRRAPEPSDSSETTSPSNSLNKNEIAYDKPDSDEDRRSRICPSGRSSRRRYKIIMVSILVAICIVVALIVSYSTKTQNHYSFPNAIGLQRNQTMEDSIHKQLRTSRKPQIPRRLIFTYKYNLIAPSKEDPPFDANDPLTSNVLHTIELYTKFWNVMDAAERSRSRHSHSEPDVISENNSTKGVTTSFLSDADCVVAIKKSEPRLLPHFQNEKRGEYKADMCRVAALYLDGGYYFDIDIGVVSPIDFNALEVPSENPLISVLSDLRMRAKLGNSRQTRPLSRDTRSHDSIVTFATVYNKQGRFFQAFTAAMPRHPVLRRSLEYMVAYYEGTMDKLLPNFILDNPDFKARGVPSRKNTQGMGVGPFTLMVAYRATENEEWEEYVRIITKEGGIPDGNDGKKSSVRYPLHAKSKNVGANKKYSRFLYEISLQDELILKSGVFKEFPLQDADYKQKVKWCNFVCFEGSEVYFYSRVKGSKGCPVEKNR